MSHRFPLTLVHFSMTFGIVYCCIWLYHSVYSPINRVKALLFLWLDGLGFGENEVGLLLNPGGGTGHLNSGVYKGLKGLLDSRKL